MPPPHIQIQQQLEHHHRVTLTQSERIPCCRPLLPTADAVWPYLQEIDHNRWYSNFGPLVGQFEARLADHFGVQPTHVATVANATLGLSVALRYLAEKPGGLCLMPSWTFPATPHAAISAGLEPCFVDVDADSWATTPEIVAQALATIDGEVAAVVVVAPFGAPVDIEAWEQFQTSSELAVIIDAAAGFDSARIGRIPTVVSLHATKIFGVGEGGCVVSTDRRLTEEIRRRSNFGFFEARHATVASTNAKLSEYHAAVGLAGFDDWSERRKTCMRSASLYAQSLRVLGGARFQPGWGSEWVSNTAMLAVDGADVRRLSVELHKEGIEAQRWWGDGCLRHRAFAHCGHTDLINTERLANSVVGLPFFADMTEDTVRHVTQTVKDVVRRIRASRREPASGARIEGLQ